MWRSEAERILNGEGYRVRFHRRERGILFTDSFPDKCESPIKSYNEAFVLASRFASIGAKREDLYVNVCVVHSDNGAVVEGTPTLNPYPEA